jgi:hypothetical protein
VARYLHARKSGQFLTFNGRKSNCQLAITYVLSPQMDHASPFQTSKFQEISNDINIFLIQWVLTLAIALWRFKSPLGLQLPKWEFTWECRGSFPHTLMHSQEHEMWLTGSLLSRTFASPCLGHERKDRVTTLITPQYPWCNFWKLKPLSVGLTLGHFFWITTLKHNLFLQWMNNK